MVRHSEETVSWGPRLWDDTGNPGVVGKGRGPRLYPTAFPCEGLLRQPLDVETRRASCVTPGFVEGQGNLCEHHTGGH